MTALEELPNLLPHGKYLVKGSWVWSMKATYGLPLGYAFDWLKNRGMVPDWLGLILAAEEDGMDILKAMDTVCYEIKETWGAKYAENVKSVMLYALVNDRLTPTTWESAMVIDKVSE